MVWFIHVGRTAVGFGWELSWPWSCPTIAAVSRRLSSRAQPIREERTNRRSREPALSLSKGTLYSIRAQQLKIRIGDTIRVSLTPAPQGDRTEEVHVAQQILQSLGIRSFSPQVTACPGCGRTTSTFFQELADRIQTYLREQMPVWREKYSGVEELRVAVMGCVVNGPGESKHAHIGISLPGSGEEPKAPVYVDGKLFVTLKGETIAQDFNRILNQYLESHFGVHAANLQGR